MARHTLLRRFLFGLLVGTAWWLGATGPASAQDRTGAKPSIIHEVHSGERLEMVVHTSRILTLELPIPQVAVQNGDVLTATPLSPTQIQVSAKKPGITQVNLWDEKSRVHTIDVVVIGDARELTDLLNTEFPGSSIKVRPVGNGALVSGYVDRPEDLERIKALAEEYYPKVIMNITVGGVQQVQLHVRVYEVSRTKIRTMGFDFAQISSANMNTLMRSGISGLIATLDKESVLPRNPPVSNVSTFQFGIVDGNNAFFGVLEALCQSDVAKVRSEPRVVAISGRPAYFAVGGEIPFPVSQGLGAVEVDWKKYGTRVDFVPIVLGNNRIRLELRPRVSEIDSGRTTVQGVPALKESVVDTAVELRAGETLAIAGLVQTRVEARNKGFPWLSDAPYLGALFRRVHEEKNEIETLILVTPDFVDAMEAHEVPQCGPGTRTASPSDWELYMKGHIEVPNLCPPCNDGSACPNGSPSGAAPGESMPEGPLDDPAGPQSARVAPGGRMAGAAGRAGAASPAQRVPYSKASPPTVARAPAAAAPRRPNPAGPSTTASADGRNGLPGFMGPIGYDVAD